ncbi:MAG: hypothetical protein AAF911_12120 [Planctomycetota bacterium]
MTTRWAGFGEVGAKPTHTSTAINNTHPTTTATSGQAIPDELDEPLDMFTA